MTTDAVELVVFDLGGVMVRLAGRWVTACDRIGVAAPTCLADRAFVESLLPLIDAHERGDMLSDEFDEQIARRTGLTPQQVREVSTAWLVGPYPGLDEMLDAIAAYGLRTACLSNTNDHHWSLMTTAGNAATLPLHRLDYRFASHEVRMRKPEEAIYRHVEVATGIDPRRIVFFDDNEPNIEAAHRCGWRAHRIDPFGDPAQQVRGFLKLNGR